MVLQLPWLSAQLSLVQRFAGKQSEGRALHLDVLAFKQGGRSATQVVQKQQLGTTQKRRCCVFCPKTLLRDVIRLVPELEILEADRTRPL